MYITRTEKRAYLSFGLLFFFIFETPLFLSIILEDTSLFILGETSVSVHGWLTSAPASTYPQNRYGCRTGQSSRNRTRLTRVLCGSPQQPEQQNEGKRNAFTKKKPLSERTLGSSVCTSDIYRLHHTWAFRKMAAAKNVDGSG